MRRFALPVLILATVIVAAALAWFTLTRGGGSGADVTTEVRPVDPFHRLEISGRADVTLVEGQSESVTVEMAARGQPRVLARIENGTLMIDAGDSRRRWWNALIGRRAPATPPRISVAFKSLDAIALSGTVKLTADRISATDLRLAASGGSTVRLDDIDAQSIRIIGSGALKATLAGKVVEQKIEISGAGEIHADRLASQDAVVEVSGAGSIIVNVAKTLRATISGAGSVEYYGDPEVRQSISGVGRVKKRQSAALGHPAVAGLAASLHSNV